MVKKIIKKRRRYYGVNIKEHKLALKYFKPQRGVKPIKIIKIKREIDKIKSIGRKIIKSRLLKRSVERKVSKISRLPRKLKSQQRARDSTPIGKVFRKSTAKMVIKDILPIKTSEINNQYKRLFKNIIYDKDIMDIMIRQENIQKINWRMEIRANIYDIKGEKIMSMIKGSGGDLMKFREILDKGIWKGASVDYDIDLGDGYKFTMIKKGNIDRVEVVVIFRS